MSNAIMNFLRTRTPWRTSFTLRQLSCTTEKLSNEITKMASDNDPDGLNSYLQTANSASKILEIVHENYRKMNDKHSMEALRTIFNLQKDGMCDISKNQLVKHPDFEKICSNIKRYSGVLELNDTIEALKVLNYMAVPTNSTIIQVLLQLIRKNINSLSIAHILYVDFLLRTTEKTPTPLSEALLIALPIVFSLNVKLKMNYDNMQQMIDCLHYAVKHNVDLDIINYIIKQLEKCPVFDASSARSILLSICHLPRDDLYEPLVKKATADLIVDIDHLSIKSMEIIMNKLAHKYTKSYTFYYQEVLLDTVANYIIDHNLGFKRAVGVLRNMARLNHFNQRLLDYTANYIHLNPETEQDAADIYSIVVNMVLTDYRPAHWDNLKSWMSSAKNLATANRREIIWIRFAAALCILDICKIDILSRALNETYVTHILDKGFQSDFENYFAIWQYLTAYKPDLVQLLPSQVNPKNLVKDALRKEVFPLDGALQTAFGGKEFVKTNLFSKLGVQIDHAIIFSNGSPVPFKQSVEFVEDIKLGSPSEQLLLIWAVNNNFYTINTNTLRGLPSKTLTILEETLQCSVLPVNTDNWQEMADFEKIPYLMQKIKDKMNLDINVLESVA
ncbi:unnamed protein product [Ceutorhynchus assimilis]|uniref:Uncharacterized protein n=1 Tax=Ceutorhynchus assimilis TaxID=467358 RepID=A0A9N9QM70_9CUCU|nr:unnamed protein product [Ceutorhynchus assimilis]